MENKIKNLQELIEKADQIKKQEKMDLSSDQDLTIAIMNLISIEEHLFFTGAKTGKNEYYDLILEVREMRKQLLKKIIKEYEGEVWCISKHLLASSMRLMEVGTKQLSIGNNRQAYELFGQAYQLYSLFWGLHMKLLTGSSAQKTRSGDSGSVVQSVADSVTESVSKETAVTIAPENSAKKGIMSTLGDFVKKVVDCCIE